MSLRDNSASDARGQWDARINRARELREQCGPASDILLFYEKILGFQRSVAGISKFVLNPETPLREQIDLSSVSSELISLLSLTAVDGPERLRQEAERLQHAGAGVWIELLWGRNLPPLRQQPQR